MIFHGPFYVLLKYSNFTSESSLTFAMRFLERGEVAVVPEVKGCMGIRVWNFLGRSKRG